MTDRWPYIPPALRDTSADDVLTVIAPSDLRDALRSAAGVGGDLEYEVEFSRDEEPTAEWPISSAPPPGRPAGVAIPVAPHPDRAAADRARTFSAQISAVRGTSTDPIFAVDQRDGAGSWRVMIVARTEEWASATAAVMHCRGLDVRVRRWV